MIFSLHSSSKIAMQLSKILNEEICYVDLLMFKQREISIESCCCNENIFVLFPNTDDVNHDLVSFLLMSRGLQNIRAIMPYMPYSRQEKNNSFDMIVKILKLANLASIVTLDLHTELSMALFDLPIVNIRSFDIFCEHFQKTYCHFDDVVIVAPDKGAIERASAFAKTADAPLICIDKVSKTVHNAQAISGKRCVLVDDIVNTGRTMNLAVDMLCGFGAQSVDAYVTHFIQPDIWPLALGNVYVANDISHDPRCVLVDWPNTLARCVRV